MASRRRYEFSEAEVLAAGAIGVPGKRSFYILAGEGGTVVRLLVEKEQLLLLSEAIDRIISELSGPKGAPAAHQNAMSDETRVDGEIRVGRMALAVDEGRQLIGMFAFVTGSKEYSPPTVRCWATANKMEAFARQIDEVCSAGRPLCPLCDSPMDPEGHICPRRNGHRSEHL